MFRKVLVVAALTAGLGPCSKKEDVTPPPEPKSEPVASAAPSAKPDKPEKPKEVPFEDLVKTSTPLTFNGAEQELGGSKLKSEPCKIEGGPFLGKSTSGLVRSVRAVGDRVLLVTEAEIRGYKLDDKAGCSLTIDKTFGTDGVAKLDNKIERITADSAGNVWATSGVFGSYKLAKDGSVAMKCDARPLGYFFVNPSGRGGIGTFANADTAKVTIAGTSCTSEKWAFQGLSTDATRKGNIVNAQAVGYVGDTIFMGAKLAKSADPNESIVVLALDQAGKEKFKIGKMDKDYSTKDRFGWVHAIAPCRVGVCVLDSNYRRITGWKTADGKFVGSVDLSALFGVKYPWIADFDRTQKATFFVVAQDRETKGVTEGNVFRVTNL